MLKSGSILGTYKILSRIGGSSGSEIFEAQDQKIGRKVALRVLSDGASRDPKLIQRFKKAAQELAALNHGGIVQILQIDEADGHAFCVMPYLGAGNLRDWLAREKPNQANILSVMLRIAEALAFAHQQGLIHRDLKPENIMISGRGDPQIADFGLARALRRDPDASSATVMDSDPRYTSPEEARGQPLDERSDIYALGVMLFEALAGRVPFDGDEPLALMFKHVTEAIPELPPEHAALQGLINRMMAKKPADRPSSAGQLCEELRKAGGGKGLAAGPLPVAVESRAPRRPESVAGSGAPSLAGRPDSPEDKSAARPPATSSAAASRGKAARARKPMAEVVAEARRRIANEAELDAGQAPETPAAVASRPKLGGDEPTIERPRVQASSNARLVVAVILVPLLFMGVLWFFLAGDNGSGADHAARLAAGDPVADGAPRLRPGSRPEDRNEVLPAVIELTAEQRQARINREKAACPIHVSELSDDGDLLYEDARNMEAAKYNAMTGAVRLPPVKTADGQEISFEVTPDGCARVARRY